MANGTHVRELVRQKPEIIKSINHALGTLNDATMDSLREIRDVSAESVTLAKNRAMESVGKSPWYYLGGTAVAASLLGFFLGRKTKSSKREV